MNKWYQDSTYHLALMERKPHPISQTQWKTYPRQRYNKSNNFDIFAANQIHAYHL
jgi:hypothetical protein